MGKDKDLEKKKEEYRQTSLNKEFDPKSLDDNVYLEVDQKDARNQAWYNEGWVAQPYDNPSSPHHRAIYKFTQAFEDYDAADKNEKGQFVQVYLEGYNPETGEFHPPCEVNSDGTFKRNKDGDILYKQAKPASAEMYLYNSDEELKKLIEAPDRLPEDKFFYEDGKFSYSERGREADAREEELGDKKLRAMPDADKQIGYIVSTSYVEVDGIRVGQVSEYSNDIVEVDYFKGYDPVTKQFHGDTDKEKAENRKVLEQGLGASSEYGGGVKKEMGMTYTKDAFYSKGADEFGQPLSIRYYDTSKMDNPLIAESRDVHYDEVRKAHVYYKEGTKILEPTKPMMVISDQGNIVQSGFKMGKRKPVDRAFYITNEDDEKQSGKESDDSYALGNPAAEHGALDGDENAETGPYIIYGEMKTKKDIYKFNPVKGSDRNVENQLQESLADTVYFDSPFKGEKDQGVSDDVKASKKAAEQYYQENPEAAQMRDTRRKERGGPSAPSGDVVGYSPSAADRFNAAKSNGGANGATSSGAGRSSSDSQAKSLGGSSNDSGTLDMSGLDAALNAFGDNLDRSGDKWKLKGDYAVSSAEIQDLKLQFNKNRNALTRYYSGPAKADYQALQSGKIKYSEFAKRHPEAHKMEQKLTKIMKDGKAGDRGFLQNWINDKAESHIDGLKNKQSDYWEQRKMSLEKENGDMRGGLPSMQLEYLKSLEADK